MDVPAPGVGAVCGACPHGYTGDASKCYGMCGVVSKTILSCVQSFSIKILMSVHRMQHSVNNFVSTLMAAIPAPVMMDMNLLKEPTSA